MLVNLSPLTILEETFAVARLALTEVVLAPSETNLGPVFKTTFAIGKIVSELIATTSVLDRVAILKLDSKPDP